MVDFLILYRDFGSETGVTVSIKHLKPLMERENFSYLAYGYRDDQELLHLVKCHDSRVVMLQAPTFMPDTLMELIGTGRYVNLVIHSTISFLQVEEEAFANIQRYMAIKSANFSISNPCLYEVDGFKSYARCEVFYLPNTFNKQMDSKSDIAARRIEKACLENIIRIGIFCAYRPFKNIMTQITACNLLQKQMGIKVELHMFGSNERNPVYRNALQLLDNMQIRCVLHENCANDKLYEILQDIDIGLQVSYSETFSYILCEHMMLGTPTVSSTTVPFANRIAEFNDATSIAENMGEICESAEAYRHYVSEAVDRIAEVKESNNHDALVTLTELAERSKNCHDREDEICSIACHGFDA